MSPTRSLERQQGTLVPSPAAYEDDGKTDERMFYIVFKT